MKWIENNKFNNFVNYEKLQISLDKKIQKIKEMLLLNKVSDEFQTEVQRKSLIF